MAGNVSSQEDLPWLDLIEPDKDLDPIDIKFHSSDELPWQQTLPKRQRFDHKIHLILFATPEQLLRKLESETSSLKDVPMSTQYDLMTQDIAQKMQKLMGERAKGRWNMSVDFMGQVRWCRKEDSQMMLEGTPHYQIESNLDSTYVTVTAGERELNHFKTKDLKDYKELFWCHM